MVLTLVVLAPTAHADGFFGSVFNRGAKTQPAANRPASRRQSVSDSVAPTNPLGRLPVNSTYTEKRRFPFPSRFGAHGGKDANQKVLSRLLPQTPKPQTPFPPASVRQATIQQVGREYQAIPSPPQPFPRVAQLDDEENDEDEDDDMMDDTDEDETGDEDEDPSDLLSFDRDRSISQIQPTLDYAFQEIDRKELPKDNAVGFNQGVYQPRQMPARNVHWAASDLNHHPLYFEDPALERYGHTHNKWLQPFVSSGRFVGQTVGLPYQMAMDPPWTSRSTLGWYRPGECAPRLKYRIPVNGKGTSAEVISIVALLLLIP